MAVYLILVVILGGMPAFDFMVFQDMKSCLAKKAEVEVFIKERKLPKPIYLECKSDPGETSSAQK